MPTQKKKNSHVNMMFKDEAYHTFISERWENISSSTLQTKNIRNHRNFFKRKHL